MHKMEKEIKKDRKKIKGMQFGIELEKSDHLPFLWHDEAITLPCVLFTVNVPHYTLADAPKTFSLFGILVF